MYRRYTYRINNNFSGYDLPKASSKAAEVNPFKYDGKEFEERQGVNIYDFNARTYAADIARFMQPDPNASDYHWLSPYAYCGGDPINNIDPDGKNIAILIENGLIGHLALLIQEEEHMWRYYSFNGTNIYELTNGYLGGGPDHDVGRGSWSSPQEFLDQAHKTTKEEREKNTDVINNYDYTDAYEIETTPEQDNIIKETFTMIR